ncbi:MAG: LysR family transcriptional regulator [Thiolinea sp.]
MNLSALQTFLAIMETGSLVKASLRLHVSQSTVTARLQSLESDLGQTLFVRQKSGVSMTASGLKFKRYAEAMTDLWRQAQQETSLPDGISSVCNLGCHLDLWPETGRGLMRRIHQDYPQTALSAWPGKHDELDQWMSTGLIDAALTYRPTTRENQTIHSLRSEPLILVSNRPDTPMRNDPHYVYVDAGEDFGRRHTAAYSDAGVAKVSFGCAVWALDYLLEQDGSAYLPERLAEPYIASGQLFPIVDAPVFSRHVYLIVNDQAAMAWEWLGAFLNALDEIR